MRITKAFLAKLSTDTKATLAGMTKTDIEHLLTKANDAYHGKGDSLIPDTLFDLVKDHYEHLTEAPIEFVGTQPVAGKKVKLPVYMGSMDKIKTDDKALENFRNKFATSDYLASDKLDGISALLHVTCPPSGQSGSHVALYTRGDGHVGQDITHLLQTINGLPPTATLLEYAAKTPNHTLTVRGELILTRQDFESVRHKGANARNMVAGIVNAKKPDLDVARLIKFVTYALIEPESYAPADAYQVLQSLAFTVAYHEIIPRNKFTFETLSDILVKRRKASPFEVDGIVVYHNEPHPHETGKNPKHAFAFKNIITQETVEVTVSNIEWNASKDGYLVPVVEFEPVKLAGVMVKRASGFNAEYIHTNSLGPGARIVVTRSGDVIPYILEVLERAPQPQMPKADFSWNDTRKDIILKNASSNKQVQMRQLENFFAKLNIPGLRAGTVARLYEAGFNSVHKIVSASPNEIASLDGFQDKSATKLIEGIRTKTSSLTCVELMDASNAFGRGFGSKRLQAIVDALPAIASSESFTPSVDQLVAIPGVSNKTATAFIEGLHAFRGFKKITKLNCDTHHTTQQPTTSSERLAGQFIVFTGFRDTDLKAAIERHGGTVSDTISKKTTILIAKDLSKATSKVQKAQEQGTQVYTQDQFITQHKLTNLTTQ